MSSRLLFAFQQIKKFRALERFGCVSGGKVRLIDQTFAWGDFKAAGAADHEIALHAGGAQRLDEGPRIAAGEMYRAHRGVMTFEKRGEAALVRHVTLFCSHLRQRGDLLRIASDRGDRVAAIRKLLEDARASSAGGANQCNTSHNVFRPFCVAGSVKNPYMVT